MEKIISNSLEETENLANDFAKKIKEGEVMCLYGNLGAGKTTFTQNLIKSLGVKKRVISPTFIIIRSYKITTEKTFYHVDLYRLGGEKDLESTGLLDILKDKSAIIAIEWPEKMGSFIPKKRWEIKFKYIDENKREISFEKFE